MNKLTVLVASQNKVKRLAVQHAFENSFHHTVSVASHTAHINSGVMRQPLSTSESAKGALNRLKEVMNIPGFDYYVAIESGVHSVETPIGTKWFESACAAVAHDSSSSIAYGPSVPMPDTFIQGIEAGDDLSTIMEKQAGIKNAGEKMGFTGWLTDNLLSRQDASALAVLLAIKGLQHEIRSL